MAAAPAPASSYFYSFFIFFLHFCVCKNILNKSKLIIDKAGSEVKRLVEAKEKSHTDVVFSSSSSFRSGRIRKEKEKGSR